MTYRPREGVDARTRSGLRAVFVRYDDTNWPAPWIFEVNGDRVGYSIGGFYGSHRGSDHELDLVGDWPAPGHLQEIRERHAEAVAQFGHHYEPRGLLGMPVLTVGVQSFALAVGNDTEEHREWLGIMLCAALKELVKEHTEGDKNDEVY